MCKVFFFTKKGCKILVIENKIIRKYFINYYKLSNLVRNRIIIKPWNDSIVFPEGEFFFNLNFIC